MKRATGKYFRLASYNDISIHALVKRATRNDRFTTAADGNFNPRPREEGDLTVYRCSAFQLNFNPRPREEGDNRPEIFIVESNNFNPRPREEGDSFHCLYYIVPLYFNPRPREEGDKFLIDRFIKRGISIHALVKRATRLFRLA